ncbi:protein translocase subunit SecF [uncultured Tyzzerella sp.]|uniref:protein translocase subunit SecF n=1 Tax=uncultured Tyzzerella sp. TaxID=2321398 RepID=UPI002943AEB3|nr:protein translocase subunit SecF [uncultured Tyzzerella sp.]
MNIIKNRYIYFAISIIIIAVGLGFMFYNNSQGKGFFNYDIQFTGGTSIEVSLGGKEVKNEDIANLLKDSVNIDNAQIQIVGNGESVIIKMRSLNQEERVALTDAISKKYSLTDKDYSIRDISATISSEMKRSSILAIVVSCIAMLIYVSFRFKNFKTGASAIIALLHDALILVAFYAIFRVPLNDAFIAAILTVLGYSINATIVIFDRIRENKGRAGKIDEKLINDGINQSLRRSIFTSLTTFFTVISLYIFGVESVKVFALPIAIGIICGTYSSIFIAGPIWYMLNNFKTKNS